MSGAGTAGEGMWIACAERMPEPNDCVLAWRPGTGWVVSEFLQEGDSWEFQDELDCRLPGVTHWMPLPKPPEAP